MTASRTEFSFSFKTEFWKSAYDWTIFPVPHGTEQTPVAVELLLQWQWPMSRLPVWRPEKVRLLSSLSSRWLVKAIERASLISATSDSLLTLKIYQTLIEFYLKERKKERKIPERQKERKKERCKSEWSFSNILQFKQKKRYKNLLWQKDQLKPMHPMRFWFQSSLVDVLTDSWMI